MSGTTGLDPTISLRAGQQPQGQQQQQNPLQMFGQVLQAKQALNQLQLFPGQQELQQQHILGAQLANQGAQLDQLKARLTYGNGALLGLLLDPNGNPTTQVSSKDIAKTLASAVADGYLKASDAVNFQSSLPNGGEDPVANRQSLVQHFAANVMANGHVDQALSVLGRSPSSVSTGGGTKFGSIGGGLTAAPGAFQPQTNVANTVSPESAAASQTLTGTNGVPITAPAGTRMPPSLVPPQMGGTGGGVQQLTPQSQGLGSGAPPAAAQPPQAPPSPTNQPRLPGAAQPVTPGAGGAPMAGPSIGSPKAMEASADHYSSASAAANNYNARVFPLQQAATALANTPTGPGTETVNQIKSFLLAQSPDALKEYLPGVDPKSIQNYDEAVKYLAQYASNQPGASGSDMRTELSQVSNASTHISNQAARAVVTNALGLERMQQAAVLSFPGGTQNAGQFDTYMRQFQTQNDPRGFSWDARTPEEKAAIVKGMSRPQKERLLSSVNLAKQLDSGGINGQ